MPDRHRLKLFSHFKHQLPQEESLNRQPSDSSSGRKFLGFHIGKHDSQESLASPTMTNSSEKEPKEHEDPHKEHLQSNRDQSKSPSIVVQHASQNPTQAARHHSIEDSLSPKSHGMADLKRLFKNKKSNQSIQSPSSGSPAQPAVEKVQNGNTEQTNGALSPPANTLAPHSRAPLLTSLAALINQTSSQLLNSSQATKRQEGPVHEPFTQDGSPLVKKYGKVEKELGSGAGGSVRLIMRPLDRKTFAVKEFRPRRNTESFKDYTRKCTAEYCIGSTLKHPNIIKTIDIIHENNRYYEVMEYAPIDFFAVVMSGEMSRQEINCCLKQILEGVSYLHSLGLAHRDLKLDNCVLTTDGILKIIDFGSAVIFKYPYDQHGPNSNESIHYCHGVVGSDPYLAPEVLTSLNSYNPQPVDLWSIAIIYCCMTLKRFPWKIPNAEKDNSFKLYAMEDDNWHDYYLSNECHKLLLRQRQLKNTIIKLNKKSKLLQRQKEQQANEPHEGDDAETVEAVEDKLQSLLAVKVLDEEETQEVLNELKSIDAKLEEFENIKTEQKALFQKRREEADANTNANANANTEPGAEKATEDSPKSEEKRSKSHKLIHGPYRLMRLLPHASRPIIHKMLQIDPRKRASIEEILLDDWIKEIECCTLKAVEGVTAEDEEEMVLVPGKPPHEHTIVMDDDKDDAN